MVLTCQRSSRKRLLFLLLMKVQLSRISQPSYVFSDVEIKQPVSEPKPKHSLLKKSPKKRRAAEQQGWNTVASSIINPLSPNSDLSEMSHCRIKGLSVREVARIENMIIEVKFS